MINLEPESLRTVFTQNRTEELGNDVWEHFVIPPFFEQLDLQQARKPRVIVGGRGCGKTMLLRYLSYHSTLSPSRPVLPPEALNHVGLYWRADTQFANLMIGRGLTPEVWASAFNHLLALMIAAELLDSLHALSNRKAIRIPAGNLNALQLPTMQTYGLGQDFLEIRDNIEAALHEFELWVNNVGKMNEPIFFPGSHFLVTLIKECVKQIPDLARAVFFVYLDEYENLLEYQQRIINTCLKHSQAPLIFNIAMKRNGFRTHRTVGEESIVDIADYRTHDIEQYLSDSFNLFAAEVLLLTLHLAKWRVPISAEQLRDPDQLSSRRTAEYKDTVLVYVRDMFPTVSQRELAVEVMSDKFMRNKLRKTLAKALGDRGTLLHADSFIREDLPEASIVSSALLYRRLDPQAIYEELDALSNGKANRFTGSSDWINNYFIGCLLSLYESTTRICPFYAGFETFISLSKGNLRHFLELCHQSLNEEAKNIQEEPKSVDPLRQALAARHTSATFLAQIKSFGRLGNRLHMFVLRLGSLFALSHQRPTQSEPEVSHFSITRGKQALSEEDEMFLTEAVKWSVLLEEEETKVKESVSVANQEYVLNPIYAPYFEITYRKRRRLSLTVEEFITLEKGTYDQVNMLLKTYSKKWDVDLPEANPTLFSHLYEEV